MPQRKHNTKKRPNMPKNKSIDPKKGKKLNKGKKGKKGKKVSIKKSKSTKTQYSGILDPNRTLTGKDLRKAVAALVKMQTQPGLHEIDRAIKSQGALGQQATTNIQNYFNQIQAQGGERASQLDALRASLSGSVATAGSQAQESIGAAGTAAQAGLTQPSSAREQLAQLVAMQQGHAARENQAMSAHAGSQGTAFSQLQQTLQGSSNLRGQQLVGDVNRQSQNEINRLSGKRGEILSQIPELTMEGLMELRERERNYTLGAGALGVKRKETKAALSGKSAGQQYLKQAGKTYGKLNKQKAKQSQAYLDASTAAAAGLAAQKGAISQATIAQMQAGYNQGGGKGTWWKQGSSYKSPKQAVAMLRANVRPGRLRSDKSAKKAAAANLVNAGVHPKLAKLAIKKYTRRPGTITTKQARRATKQGHKRPRFGR